MSDKSKIRLGLLQGTPGYLELDRNLRYFEKMALRAHERGVEFLITCESCLDGICAGPKGIDRKILLSHAQELESSRYLQRVRAVARETAMHIVFRFTQRPSSRGDRASG